MVTHCRTVQRFVPWLVLLVAFLAGCGGGPVARPGSAGPAPTAIAPPPARELSGCLDATLSSSTTFAPSFQRALAGALTAQAHSDGSLAARPGFTLELRQVTSTSFSTDGPQIRFTVPELGGLPAEPGTDDPDLAEHGAMWAELAATRDRAAAARSAALERAADDVRNWPLRRAGSSQVLNCVAALADDAGRDSHLVVVSDLADNAPPGAQVSGVDLRGASVSVIQACPAAAVTRCAGRLRTFSRWVQKHGGRVTAHARADDMAGAVTTWIGGVR